jgi:hypothetical protein
MLKDFKQLKRLAGWRPNLKIRPGHDLNYYTRGWISGHHRQLATVRGGHPSVPRGTAADPEAGDQPDRTKEKERE